VQCREFHGAAATGLCTSPLDSVADWDFARNGVVFFVYRQPPREAGNIGRARRTSAGAVSSRAKGA